MSEGDVIEKIDEDLYKKLFPNGPVDLDPDDEVKDKPEEEKPWCNWYRWRHPEAHLPRPDGSLIPPGGEFRTRGEYPSAKAAAAAADKQMYGYEGKTWSMEIRPFLQYLGPRKVGT